MGNMSCAGLIAMLNQNVFLILTSTFFSMTEVGYLTIANRIVLGPINLIVESVKQVFVRKLVSVNNIVDRYKFLININSVLLFLSVLFSSMILMVGFSWMSTNPTLKVQSIFTVILAMIPFLVTKMTFSLGSPFLNTLGREKNLLFLTIIYFGLILLSYSLSFLFENFIATVWGYSIASSLYFALLHAQCYQIAHQPSSNSYK